MEMQTKNYDVAIIGGGAAGLSAAAALGRSRRSVVVIDAGEPRNAPAAAMHNFLSRDGMNPLELLKEGRAELVKYGVEVINTRALDSRRSDAGFTITLGNGTEVSARRLILATGLKDQLPDIAGLAEHWGNDVLHCPYCHGWEVKDLRLGVVDSAMAMHQAPMFTQWSNHVTLFKDPNKVLAAEELEQLEALGVEVVEAAVTAVLGEAGSVQGVELSDRTQREIDALVITPNFDVDVSCVKSLGLVTQEHVSGIGRHVPVDDGGQTEVPGLWLAGNVANPMAQVIMAAADGLGMGLRVNADLMQEEFARKVAELRMKKAAVESVGQYQ
ncbi:NAD(P)/FAD-dependent oxidoreductase [Arthrobacter sp. VKM Ac-2550]|uniref:NAD(P)/FAD-dependent oxidoreductase n=1 Tax=Crystallibacter permensis TaxID=1938888 RepID=UPI0022269E09|nr:NAD(P)/FAD-dependent oxidoreductase [Arthrobacter sp. VKM Ac-2550]MCW2130886.1 Thioredoxin reductase [Arthrobacter sp. VKM Ac-2550]